MFRIRRGLRVWPLSLFLPLFCFAQVNTATVYGTITDSSGAAVTQATVNASNQQTGGSWTATSNAQGEYTLTFLPVGAYTLSIQATGFREWRNTGISLTGAQRLRLQHTLEVGAVNESVTVTDEAPIINSASAEQGHNLNTKRIEELPTQNRDWSALLGLGAGLAVSGSAVSMNGLPQDGFRFTVDGANASGSGEQETMTSLGFIKAVSLEAIKEVNVTSGIAPAETGPTMSGNVNVITKGGTNEIHGSLFENNRTENVAARNQFLTTRPPVVFNQFGGSVGGPIIKNKLFYFGVYEGYRSREFASVNGNVPTAEFRAAAVAANPSMQVFFDSFPLPNTSYSPGAITGFYQSAGSSRQDSDHFSVRGDYMLTDTDMLSVRYTYDMPFQLTPRVSSQNSRTFDVRTHKGVASYIHSGAAWSSESRLGYNRFERVRLDNIYSLGVSDISGSLGFSNGGELMENLGTNYSFDQVMALNRGSHSIKYGFLYQMWESGRNNETVPTFQYANAADLFANRPSQVTISFGVRPYTLRNWVSGFFLQDDYRVTRNLILNLGIRADWFSVPKEDSGRLFNRTGPFGIGPYTDPDSIYKSNGFNFSPRIGFAWSVNPKTVIRGGSGIFTTVRNQFGGPVDLVQNAIDEPNRVVFSGVEAAAFGISYPTTNAEVLPLVKGSGPIAGTVISQNFPQPYSIQWTLGIAREIGSNFSIESMYVGNHAVFANVVRRINQVDPMTGLRPYAGYSEFNYYDGSESTRYNAWQNTLRRRFSNGFQFGAMYEWAKSISHSADATISLPKPPQDSDNIRGDKGPSPFDIRQRFAADAMYELPLLRLIGKTGRGSQMLFGGWQLSGIYTAATGSPINVTQSTSNSASRPDYIGGNPYMDDAEQTLQYLNRAAFRMLPTGIGNAPLHLGSLGRHALRGLGYWNFDLGLAKNLALSERYHLQIRADMFNAFNHTNFSGISTGINAGNFGRFTSTRGARVVQFNARLTF